jgi:methyl-accepting chemotaxis protein
VGAILNGGEVEGNQIVATDNDGVRAAVEEMDQNHTDFQKKADTLMAMHREAIAQAVKVDEAMARMDAAGEEADLLLTKVEEAAGEEMATAKAEGNASRQNAVAVMCGVTAVAVVLGILIGVLLTRSITRPFKEIFRGLKSFSRTELKETSETFNRIIEGMTDSVDQVNDAAAQVSGASQQLAEGASEQASSLEETSSALEQMAAMTRTNAGNSKEANDLATQAHKAANEGETTMTAINESSDQISKIIKVIEEIAFQTNLLALNAAVEAARAGEHGKGFAVVADEVRNLAQRAAQAAKEITSLIENSGDKSKEGVAAIKTIVEGVAKVAELLDGIAQASNEQAQGVEQVNTAVSQMDKVTQQNASGAEESASAAEELSAQAQTVKGMVSELVAVVGSSGNDRGTPAHTDTRQYVTTTKKRASFKVAHLDTKPKPEPVGVTPGQNPTTCDTSAPSDGTGLPDDDNAMKDF